MKKALFSFTLIMLLSTLSFSLRAQYILTVAGNGTPAYTGDGAQATAAAINGPYGICFDASGNMFVADASNHCVRMVAAGTGVITTVAGNGTAGFGGDGGAATAAQLNTPTGVAVDGSGNIYISDQLNHRIRYVSASTGDISTFAGTGTAGFSGDAGAANAAQLNRPWCVALDASGNLYIGDRSNNRIRKVNTSGVITTEAGSGTVGFSGDGGPATAANLNRPIHIAFSASGLLYFVDNGNNRIRMIDASGNINTVAGNGGTTYAGDGAQATATGLNSPMAIAIDASGNYYIADMSNNSVRYVTASSGVITTTTGTGTAGFNGDCILPSGAQLNQPSGLYIQPATARLHIADRANNRIREIMQSCSGTPAGGSTVASVSTGCPLYSTVLTLSAATYGCDVSYQWQSSTNGFTFTNISGATSGSFTTTMASSTYFRAIVTCTTSGLSATSAATYLNVDQLPALSPITGSPIVCIGSSTTLTDTATSGTWTAANGRATVSSTGVVSGISAGLDTIAYTATNACGTSVEYFIISVNGISTPAVATSASPAFTVCNGATIALTATPYSGGPTPAYQWYVNGGFAGIGSTYSYTPANGDVVRVLMTTSDPCTTATTASHTDTIHVSTLLTPVVDVTNGVMGDSVCLGTSVTYYGNITYGGTSPTYQWTLNGVNTVTTPTFTLTPNNGDVVGVVINSSLPCASPVTASNTATVTVDTNETPDISISAYPGDTTCTGYSVTYTALVHYPGAAPLINWKKNGVNVATGFGYTYLPVSGDVIQAVMFSSAACRTHDTAFSNVMHMVVGPHTTTTVSIIAYPGTTINSGDTVTLTAVAVNAGTGATFQWYWNGAAVTGATNSTFVTDNIAEGDSIYCVVQGTNPCSTPGMVYSNGILFHLNLLSVNGATAQQMDITLFPNPNNGTFNITGNVATAAQHVAVRITDLAGRTLAENTIPAVNGRVSGRVEASLPKGIYLLVISDGQSDKTIRYTVSE
jgi:hypothetical protein